MNTININGKDFTAEELNALIEASKKNNKLDKVFAFHKTTREEFDKNYERCTLRSKYLEIEAMIVAYKNDGWEYKDGDKFYYPYFKLNPFDFDDVDSCDFSYVPLAFAFKNEKVMKEAVEEFKEEYKLSRTTL